jgi:hypothetical protein
VEADNLDRVDVLVAGQPIRITMDERAELLERLRIVVGDEGVVHKFEAAWAIRRVELDEDELGRLRMALELWKAVTFDELPNGIAHLLDALEKAAPGSSPGGASMND